MMIKLVKAVGDKSEMVLVINIRHGSETVTSVLELVDFPW